MHSYPLTRVYSHWPFQLNRGITFSLIFFFVFLSHSLVLSPFFRVFNVSVFVCFLLPVIYIRRMKREWREYRWRIFWDARGSFLLHMSLSAGSILLFFCFTLLSLTRSLSSTSLSTQICLLVYVPSLITQTIFEFKKEEHFFLHHFHTICLRIGFNVGADKSYRRSRSLVFFYRLDIKSAEL